MRRRERAPAAGSSASRGLSDRAEGTAGAYTRLLGEPVADARLRVQMLTAGYDTARMCLLRAPAS